MNMRRMSASWWCELAASLKLHDWKWSGPVFTPNEDWTCFIEREEALWAKYQTNKSGKNDPGWYCAIIWWVICTFCTLLPWVLNISYHFHLHKCLLSFSFCRTNQFVSKRILDNFWTDFGLWINVITMVVCIDLLRNVAKGEKCAKGRWKKTSLKQLGMKTPRGQWQGLL